MSLALVAYRAAMRAAGPLAPLILARRSRRGKEEPDRLNERFARDLPARPPGPLVWLHGASVGESQMLVLLAEALHARRPGLTALMTTNTVTAASLIARRAPDFVRHQYVPLDVGPITRRFLAHWRPDLAVFAESELWPNLIRNTARAGAPLALVNARMTARSIEGWRRWRGAARALLADFDWIGAADAATAAGLTDLAGRPIPEVGNLKDAAPPLAADPTALAAMRATIGDRLAWTAASTHPGEDEIALAAHAVVRRSTPGALLILVPRHPERGPDVAALSEAAGFTTARRGADAALTQETAVYVADTLGEMGVWYRLARPALVGGSLVSGIGGHNPLEPARLGAPILAGPHTHNFAEVFDAYTAGGAARVVKSSEELAIGVRALAGPDGELQAQRALALAGRGADVLEQVLHALLELWPGEADATA